MRKYLFLLVAAMLILNTEAFAQEKKVGVLFKDKSCIEVIHSRKSVRNYTGVPATKEQLEILLKAGMAAPSAMDRRPWAFVVVTDEALLAKLADGLPSSKMITRAKAAIIVCGVIERQDGEGQIKIYKTLDDKVQNLWVQGCSAASENILLAAEAIGLGAVWTGMYPSKERMAHIRSTLGIPERVMPLNVIAVGNPTGVDRPKNKFDSSNIHWDKW
ncbi:MAG: nitroreductase family protein [Candidatus Omnitrophota bacterium]